jgi:hypothetical protein
LKLSAEALETFASYRYLSSCHTCLRSD